LDVLGIGDAVVGEVAIVHVELRGGRADRCRVAKLLDLTIPNQLPALDRRVDEIRGAVAVGVARGHGVVPLSGVMEDEMLGGRRLVQVAVPVSANVENLVLSGLTQPVPLPGHEDHGVRRILT
jgi:hypothetical protein